MQLMPVNKTETAAHVGNRGRLWDYVTFLSWVYLIHSSAASTEQPAMPGPFKKPRAVFPVEEHPPEDSEEEMEQDEMIGQSVSDVFLNISVIHLHFKKLLFHFTRAL